MTDFTPEELVGFIRSQGHTLHELLAMRDDFKNNHNMAAIVQALEIVIAQMEDEA